MIPFMFVYCFVTQLIYIHTPLFNKPLVIEDKYEFFAYQDNEKTLIFFPNRVEYSNGKKFVTIVEVKF